MAKSKTYIATASGATIKEQSVNRGMSQKDFAVHMDMSEKHISHIINGEVILTPDVANRLELVLGVPTKFWNNLESIYRQKLLLVIEDIDTFNEVYFNCCRAEPNNLHRIIRR